MGTIRRVAEESLENITRQLADMLDRYHHGSFRAYEELVEYPLETFVFEIPYEKHFHYQISSGGPAEDIGYHLDTETNEVWKIEFTYRTNNNVEFIDITDSQVAKDLWNFLKESV